MSADAEVLVNTKLTGVRRFLADAQLEAAAIKEIGISTATTGGAMAATTRRSWLMNQSLFTLRRLAYGTTLGLLAAGAGALKLGHDYNTAMQGARVALLPFFNSSQELEHQLDRLWTIAKFSPFQIKDMTLAFSRMYPSMSRLGITAGETTTTIKNLTDALSVGMAGRVTPAALNRASVALQHLAFIGRLTGMSVLQLARDGIPIYAALSKELGLSAEQMHSIGKMGIPANVALKAINDYISSTPGYANAAYRLSVHSFTGLFSTFKDNISKTMGLAERGWFHGLQNMIQGTNLWFNKLNANLKDTHDLATALDQSLTPQSHKTIIFWRNFRDAMHDTWLVTKALVGGIATMRSTFAAIILPLAILRGLLFIAAHTTWFWVPGVQVLVTALIAYKGIMIVSTFWTWAFVGSQEKAAFWTRVVAVWTKYLYLEQKLLAFWTGFLSVLTQGYVRNAKGQFVAMTFLQRAALRLRLAFIGLGTAEIFAGGPLTWLVAAAILLVAGLVILYFKWHRFHEAVNATARFLYSHWYILALIPMVGPFIAVTVLIVRNLHRIIHWFQVLVGWIKSAVHWMGKIHVPHIGLPHIGNPFHGLQHGGVVTQAGAFLVGERGPELALLPAGAAITPHHTNFGQVGGRQRPIVIPITLQADGRTLAEVVARHESDVNARG